MRGRIVEIWSRPGFAPGFIVDVGADAAQQMATKSTRESLVGARAGRWVRGPAKRRLPQFGAPPFSETDSDVGRDHLAGMVRL